MNDYSYHQIAANFHLKQVHKKLLKQEKEAALSSLNDAISELNLMKNSINPTESVHKKLFIATPMYGGLCNGNYALGMIQSVSAFSAAGIQMYYSYMMNESLITRARNSMAYDFLETDADYMMFIDADIGFNPADIIKMLETDKDIICGIYPKKEMNWDMIRHGIDRGIPNEELHKWTGSFVVNLINNEPTQSHELAEPMEISNGGTGFMLIKRGVFESLKDKVPTYVGDMNHNNEKIIHEFFATSIDPESNRLLSEDYHFCQLARKNGFKVFAALWPKLVHCGAYNFSGELPKD